VWIWSNNFDIKYITKYTNNNENHVSATKDHYKYLKKLHQTLKPFITLFPAVRTLVDEKEKLLKEKSRLQLEIQAMTSHRGLDKDKLETILQEKENLMHEMKDLNDRLQMETRMLNTKVKRAALWPG
jgi:cell division FtsZ-interacting protein ZapD